MKMPRPGCKTEVRWGHEKAEGNGDAWVCVSVCVDGMRDLYGSL